MGPREWFRSVPCTAFSAPAQEVLAPVVQKHHRSTRYDRPWTQYVCTSTSLEILGGNY